MTTLSCFGLFRTICSEGNNFDNFLFANLDNEDLSTRVKSYFNRRKLDLTYTEKGGEIVNGGGVSPAGPWFEPTRGEDLFNRKRVPLQTVFHCHPSMFPLRMYSHENKTLKTRRTWASISRTPGPEVIKLFSCSTQLSKFFPVHKC